MIERDLVVDTAECRAALLSHPVYGALTDIGSLRVFMANHVFAVWDFMSLLKELQRRLTCVETPWLPRRMGIATRIVNELVLHEESDEIGGEYIDHFSLYLRAMGQLGADTAPIERLVARLGAGESVEAALADERIAPSTAMFVRSTMTTVAATTPELAAAFLYGREHMIPAMFGEILASLRRAAFDHDVLRTYLDRHIQLDGDQHGPHAQRLLVAICGTDAQAWQAASRAAENALGARHALWDGVLAQINALQR